jgi:hypothetical protein
VTARPATCPDHPNARRVERLIAFDCGDVVPEAAARRRRTVWDCHVCMDQMFTGVRCVEHNPTPEQRLARGAPAPQVQ